MPKIIYNIDVLKGCNLRCPSCPVGNMREASRPKGRMSPATLGAILDKAQRETDILYVGLFSWAEPLLHPELPALVREVKQRGLVCHLSSNLNRLANLDEVIAEHPDCFRVSLSGFTQEIYGQTHRNGNIETVKANMLTLRDTVAAHGHRTRVFVGYHRYKHNMGEDHRRMRALAHDYGFAWEPVWAYLMPVEKLLDYHFGRIAEADRPLIDLLAISPAEQKAINAPTPPCDCPLRAEQMSINSDGSVALCCGTFDTKHNIAPSFLETPYDELQARKYTHALCSVCMAHEIHKSAVMSEPEKLDAVAYRNLGRRPPVNFKQLRRETRARAKRFLRRVLFPGG